VSAAALCLILGVSSRIFRTSGRIRVKTKLAQQPELWQHIPFQIYMEEAWKDVWILLNQLKVVLVVFRYLNQSAVTYFMAGEYELWKQVWAELQWHSTGPLAVYLSLWK